MRELDGLFLAPSLLLYRGMWVNIDESGNSI